MSVCSIVSDCRRILELKEFSFVIKLSLLVKFLKRIGKNIIFHTKFNTISQQPKSVMNENWQFFFLI